MTLTRAHWRRDAGCTRWGDHQGRNFMSAEGPQAAAPSFMERPLVMATRVAVAYPYAVVALAVALAIASMALTYLKLGYRTSRLDLLNPKSDYNRLWVEYINEF